MNAGHSTVGSQAIDDIFTKLPILLFPESANKHLNPIRHLVDTNATCMSDGTHLSA